MGWFTALVLYALIWWTVLFAVLPLGIRSAEEPDPLTGWRGTPQAPRLLRTVLLTTGISALLWAVIAGIIASDWLSFRHGILQMPKDYS